MDCPGPRCALTLLDWLRNPSAPVTGGSGTARQALLWSSTPYNDESPTIRTSAELDGAFEHLEYAVFRRYENGLTRAERSRLDNTIRNALFKIDRFLPSLPKDDQVAADRRLRAIREKVEDARERSDRQRALARRADLKLAQLTNLTPEGFEEFVAEVFEALGFVVECVGGSGDEGVDLRVDRNGLRGVVQCKYHARSVVGSPEVQKFLGTIHHTASHKGYFVTTTSFSLSAERFAATHPIELIDGPRLVDLVHEALGPNSRKVPDLSLF